MSLWHAYVRLAAIIGQQGIECPRGVDFAQPRRAIGIANAPRDRRERRDVIALFLKRNEQEKDAIDGLFVDRLEGDRPAQFYEHAEQGFEALDAGMRQGETLAEPRRAELL